MTTLKSKRTIKGQLLDLIHEAEKRWYNPWSYDSNVDSCADGMESFRDTLINLLDGKDQYGEELKPLPKD